MTTPAGATVVVALLGEVALRRDGALVTVPGARSRLLLTALALRPGRSRSAQALIDDVWAEQSVRAPMNALHTQVSRLRSVLPDAALEFGPAGYRLTLRPEQVDLTLAGHLVREARRLRNEGDNAGSLAAVAGARSLWRGEPGADLPAGGLATELRTAATTRFTELEAIEVVARAADGDVDGAIAITRRRVRANPLDESAHADLMRLLAAAGRPTEALDAFAAIRSALVRELGADPGPALVELNTAILRAAPISVFPPPHRTDPGATEQAHRAAATGGAAIGVDEAPTSVPREPTPSAPTDLPAGKADSTSTASVRTATGLRAPPNALLGRDADLDALAQSLRRSRVTTVLGPGGTGKTRVANELGNRVARAESVVLVELASVRGDMGADADPGMDIETAISTALGLGEIIRDPGLMRHVRQVDDGRRLRDALSARPMLLILDNCEHLIDAVAEVVADLVGACDRLTVLTTSRAPLEITAETVYPLSPLAIDAAGSPATELFMTRARSIRPTVRLDPEVVARLCRTLDGLPLAIELAAARVRTMSVEEIETRLEHRFALLRSGDRSSPERHRTLHAVIAWSWNLLDEPQQVALRRLCRFPAGFTLAAAEVVAGGPDIDDVAMAVDGLVSQSLLTVLEDAAGGTRYRMLETVREFGEEQLAAAPARVAAGIAGTVDEGALVMHRMACWACDFSVAAAARYRTDAQVSTVLAVAAELDNLVAVLRYAVERKDASTAYRVFPVVAVLWVMRGAHMELTAWARRVVALPPLPRPIGGTVADLQMVTYLLTGLHALATGDRVRQVATVRARARRLLRTGSDLNGGIRFAGEVLCSPGSGRGLARLFTDGVRSLDRDVRISALSLRANIWENDGQVYSSVRDGLAALKLIERHDHWGTAMVCQHLGALAAQSANYTEAVGYYRRSTELLRVLPAHDEMLEIRSYLAASLIGIGRIADARKELALALGTPEADPRTSPLLNESNVQRNHRLAAVAGALAELELAEGDIDAGMRLYDRALALNGWPDDDDVTPGPAALMMAATALDARVLYGRAAQAWTFAQELARVAVDKLGQFYDLPQIGTVACAVGSCRTAIEPDVGSGLELLALATKVGARQDNPSAELRRHLTLHRTAVGNERIDNALRQVARLRRKQAVERIVELLRSFADDVVTPPPRANAATGQ